MGSDKKTLKEVAKIVDSEGLGYAIEDYMDADRIEDPKLRAEWRRAKQSIDKIREMLQAAEPDEKPED
jgi:hypothetical protein